MKTVTPILVILMPLLVAGVHTTPTDGASVPNTWSTVASMPTERKWLAAATDPSGVFYALGGATLNSLNTVEVYDPSADSWATAASLPYTDRLLAAAVGSDGRIYAMGR